MDDAALREERKARAARVAEEEALADRRELDRRRALQRIVAGFVGLILGVVGLFASALGSERGAWMSVAVMGFGIGSVAVAVGALELSGAADVVARVPAGVRNGVAGLVIVAIVTAIAAAVLHELAMFG